MHNSDQRRTTGGRVRSDRAGTRHRRLTAAVAAAVEPLGARQMFSATLDVGPLRFVTDGAFAKAGTQQTTTAAVQVGFVPAAGATFQPLIRAAGGVSLNGTATFTTHGDLGVIAGPAAAVVAKGTHTFAIADVVGGGAAIGAGAEAVNVGAERLTADQLKLVPTGAASAAAVRLGGGLRFPSLDGVAFNLDDATSFVTAAATGLQATLATGLTFAGKFTVGGTAFDGKLTSLGYDAAADRLALLGSASLALKGATLAVQVGSGTTPGLVYAKGQVASFGFTTTSDVTVGSARLTADALAATYDAAGSTYTIKGTATLAVGASKLAVTLGGGATDGLVIAHGQVSKLGLVATGAFDVGGAGGRATALAGNYVTATDTFTLRGGATIAVDGQAVGVDLGGNGTAGLVLAHGAVSALGGVVTTDLSAGGTKLTGKGLTVAYHAADRTLTVTGAA